MRPQLAIIVALLCLPGCAAQVRPVPVPQQEMSGFLDDYASLRPGGAGDVLLVYRKTDANWQAYDKVLIEPVTLWRSGKNSLAPIPEDDLLRLADDFEAAVRRRLGDSFPLADGPGPGVLLVRLGITQARASDPVLDVLTATGATGEPRAQANGPLPPEIQKFIESAMIEGELRDSVTHELLAQGVDRRRSGAPPISTWADLDALFAQWADRVCTRLEARTGRGS